MARKRKKFPTWKRLFLTCGCRIPVGSNVDPDAVTKCGKCQVKVTAIEEPAPAKEAWKLTKAEFTEQALTTDQSYQDALSNTPHNAPIARESAVTRAEKAHTKAVLDALKAGNHVPGEVLTDYEGWHKLKQEPAPVPLVESPALVIDQPEGIQLRLAL